MKKVSLFLICFVFSCTAYATAIDGQLRIVASFFGSSAPLSGDIDTGNNTFQLNSSTIYGVPAIFSDTELLAPGTYTRTYNLTAGGSVTRTETIPTGKAGAYFVISSNGSEYQVFDAWTVTSGGLNYDSINFPGNVLLGGTLNGFRVHTYFTLPALPSPVLDTTITVNGGLAQECAQFNGTNVTANVSVIRGNGAVLDRVEWTFDGVFIGEGSSIGFFAPLGSTELLAVSYATDGITTGQDLVSVVINDTTGPNLQVQFLDGQGVIVTSAPMGNYQIHFDVSDVCDSSPTVVEGMAMPVMTVVEGDLIQINSVTDVQLPTKAVQVTGTAVDASGRRTVSQGILLVE